MALRELTVDERWQLQRDAPMKLLPPTPQHRPVRDTATNEIRYVTGPELKHAPSDQR